METGGYHEEENRVDSGGHERVVKDIPGVIRPICMPDENGGIQVAPELLTEAEACRFLRFKDIGVKHPERGLSHLRHSGKLGCVRQSRRSLYPLNELMRYISELTFNE